MTTTNTEVPFRKPTINSRGEEIVSSAVYAGAPDDESLALMDQKSRGIAIRNRVVAARTNKRLKHFMRNMSLSKLVR